MAENEIARTENAKPSEMDMAGIQSFNDAMKQAESVWGSLVTTDDVLGDGFQVVSDKGQLVNVPFLILDASWSTGEIGEFWSLRVITEAGNKLVINDGSTGIARQMGQLLDSGYGNSNGHVGGVLVRNGLRVSEYDFTTESGDTKRAKTFYLAT